MNAFENKNLNTGRILAVSNSIFLRSCCRSSEREIVRVDLMRGEAFVSFRSITRSADAAVHMNLRICVDRDVMWIGDLGVASAIQRHGRGRELVEAAEAIAHWLGIRSIHLFPLWSARLFWHKMGYRPVKASARVMGKDAQDYFYDPYIQAVKETEKVATP